MDSLKGIKLARLKWVEVPQTGRPVFDFDAADVRDQWKLRRGDLETVFTDSQRSNFHPPFEHFIGTAEIGGGRFDDDLRGVIESPPFTLEANSYVLSVSGGEDRDDLYVALVDAETGDELARVTADRNNRLRKKVVKGDDWRGRRAKVRVVDDATGPWGHINLGGVFGDPMAPYRNADR